MSRDKHRKAARDTAIRKEFATLCKDHPFWRMDALLQQVADKFYLDPRTIYLIISKEEKRPLQTGKKHQQLTLDLQLS